MLNANLCFEILGYVSHVDPALEEALQEAANVLPESTDSVEEPVQTTILGVNV